MKKKKIIVHCSTNAGSSNFGDVLFAYMVLNHLQELGYQTRFYELSEYNYNYLYRIHGFEEYTFSMEEADAAIYFAGGYFGEKKHERIDLSIRHYVRFMPFGKKVLRLNIPLSIIGIGAGEYLWFPSKQAVREICDYATVITTRDEESTHYLKSIGVKKKLLTCSDIAQTLPNFSFLPNERIILQDEFEYIFLHTNYMRDVATLFCEGIKGFLVSHPNIKVIVGSDGITNIDEPFNIAVRSLGQERVIKYTYTNPENLCELLRQCKLVLTYKLHVGILSATFGSSVIAIAKHEKITRYYNQIGEIGRCVMFGDCTPAILAKLVEKYYYKTIKLPDEIINLANSNWEVLDSFLAQN